MADIMDDILEQTAREASERGLQLALEQMRKDRARINKAGMLVRYDVIWYKGLQYIVDDSPKGMIVLRLCIPKRKLNRDGFMFCGHQMEECVECVPSSLPDPAEILKRLDLTNAD